MIAEQFPIGKVKYYVLGDATKDGVTKQMDHTFHARSDEAARRYWEKWVRGHGYEPKGRPGVVGTR